MRRHGLTLLFYRFIILKTVKSVESVPKIIIFTQAETARALNIPQGTAATRQRRALQLLRLELGEEGDA